MTRKEAIMEKMQMIMDEIKAMDAEPKAERLERHLAESKSNYTRAMHESDARVKELEEENKQLESAIACMKQAVNDEAGARHDAEARVKELEGGIRKAMVRFCADGSDGAVASEMMQILAEVIGEQPTEQVTTTGEKK